MTGWREGFGSVSLHAGEHTSVECFPGTEGKPLLSLDTPRLSVMITITGDTVPAPALAFARELATQATVFAAECERLHTAQQQPSAAVPGQDSAGDSAA